jgi:hypothetical protein
MNVDVESGKTNEIGVCSVRTVVKPGRTAFDWQARGKHTGFYFLSESLLS